MRYSESDIRNSTAVVRTVCAIVFCLFSFVYLYFMQADLMAMAQHVLSNGVTHYNRLVGAVLITLFLQIVQVAVAWLMRTHSRIHALTYLPSLLVLAVITDVSQRIDFGVKWGAWPWIVPLVLVVWYAIVVFFRNLLTGVYGSSGQLSQMMWPNTLILAAMFFIVGITGNTNAVFHYRMSAEACLLDKDYRGVLEVGRKSLETDSSLTMIRAYALAREGLLGEELFSYPVRGSSDDIAPTRRGAHCMLYPNDSIYRFLGAIPRDSMRTMDYLKALLRSGQATPAVKDYILCGYLIDRQLDAFVKALPAFYEINDSLPRHYREALTLYSHHRSKPSVVYHNSVMDTDFEDLQALERQYGTLAERKKAVGGQYSGTYWWYYEYE